MQTSKLKVISNDRLNHDTFSLVLEGDNLTFSAPGQFVNVDIPGLYLRRPISVCQSTDTTVRLVFKVVGKGTALMAGYKQGDVVDVLSPLGNGFDVNAEGKKALLVGGGVGTPPLLGLAEELLKKGKEVKAVLGFNTASDIILEKDFRSLLGEGNVTVTTMDGSAGKKGLVTDALEECDVLYSCGPLPMMKAVAQKAECKCYFSLESRMGCGFGACMGCSIQTTYGAKRVCKDGPVFDGEVLIW